MRALILVLLLASCVDVSERPVVMVSMAEDSSYTITFTDQIKGLNQSALTNVLFQLGQSNNEVLSTAARVEFEGRTDGTYRQALLSAMFTPFNGTWLLNGDTCEVLQGQIQIDTLRASIAIMDPNSITIDPVLGGKALLTKAKENQWKGTVKGENVEFIKL